MSQGFTTVQYGNVTLFRCTTRSISQKEVLDSSGTNLLYMETTVDVTGYLNGHVAGTPSTTDPSSPAVFQYNVTDDGTGADPSGYASRRELQIRRQLPPRQLFVMSVGTGPSGTGGQVLLTASAAPTVMSPAGPANVPPAVNMNISNIDLANGPHCTSFVITHITGDELYTVAATFVICKLECDFNGNVPGNLRGVLSNMWSCQDTLDANLRTSRVYTGQLNLVSANLNAQQLRTIVLPAIVPMFRRDNINIVVQEDGLRLNWSVTDTEVSMAAPYPAKTWSVKHTMHASNAMIGLSTIDIELSGDTSVNKADLIELALYIITAKMFGCTPPNLNVIQGIRNQNWWNQFLVENLELVDMIGDENRIMASARVRKTMTGIEGAAVPANGNQLVIADFAQKFGVPIQSQDVATQGAAGQQPYDRSKSWGGYAGQSPPYQSPSCGILGIFTAYLQNPCSTQHYTTIASGSGTTPPLNLPTQDLNIPIVPGGVPYTVTFSTQLAPADTQNPYISTNQNVSAYTHWQLENLYKTRTMKIGMPIAGPAPVYGTPNYSDTVSTVALCGGISYRIVRVRAARIGSQPQFPDGNAMPAQPIPTSPTPPSGFTGNVYITQTFLKTVLRACTPTITVMGQKIFRAEADYVYVLSRPPNPGELLALGNDMWYGLTLFGSQLLAGNQNTDSANLNSSSWT